MGNEAATSSGAIAVSTTALVAQGNSALLHSFTLMTDGTNLGTVVIRSGGAAGLILDQADIEAGDGRSIHRSFTSPISSNDGLHVTVTGTNAEAIVHYSRQ